MIGYEQKIKTVSTARDVLQEDSKELVYDRSFHNRKTYSRILKQVANACNQALLTTADGKIIPIEAQSEAATSVP